MVGGLEPGRMTERYKHVHILHSPVILADLSNPPRKEHEDIETQEGCVSVCMCI